MRSLMSFQAKRDLLAHVVGRYHMAYHAQKSVVLNEFVAATEMPGSMQFGSSHALLPS